MVLIMTRVASGLRLMPPRPSAAVRRMHGLMPAEELPLRSANPRTISGESRSRAAAIADGVAAAQRREEQLVAGPSSSIASSSVVREPSGSTNFAPNAPLGQALRRRTTTRVSATSRSRDRPR